MLFTLKSARMYSGLSQRHLADMLGTCEDTYRKIEREPDIATIKQAKLLSAAIGISYDVIFFGADFSLTQGKNG